MDNSLLQQVIFVSSYRAMKAGTAALVKAKKLSTAAGVDPDTRNAAMADLSLRQVHSYAFKLVSEATASPECTPVDDMDKIHLQWSLPESVNNNPIPANN